MHTLQLLGDIVTNTVESYERLRNKTRMKIRKNKQVILKLFLFSSFLKRKRATSSSFV